jgi:hypothetical protein
MLKLNRGLYFKSASAAVLFLLVASHPLLSSAFVIQESPAPPTASRFTPDDEKFLDDLEYKSFEYFWQQANPRTGLVPDRARQDDAPLDANHHNVASIAATGFGLTALCIGAERKWITRAEARERTRNTLRFFANEATQEHGWFYHWLDASSGVRRWNSEVSSIDTALLLAGVLTVRQYFNEDLLI